MKFKRIYALGSDGKPVQSGTVPARDPLTGEVIQRPIHKWAGLEIVHTGLRQEQNFSRQLVEKLLEDGVATLDGSRLTIASSPEPLAYTVNRQPGYYCRSTGEAIPVSARAWARMLTTARGDLSAAEARAWLLAHGKSASDYEVCMAYECVLDTEQHDRWRAVQLFDSGPMIPAHAAEGV